MLFSNDIQTEIDRAFTDPLNKCPDNRMSLLYILRKDLQNQYGLENQPPTKITSPLLTCLGIMVGFELLAKLWSGKHEAKTKEVLDFLNQISQMSMPDAEALVQFRHAIAHGYRLETKRAKDQKIFPFLVEDSHYQAANVIKTISNKFLINIWKLKELFVFSVQEYKRLLENDFEMQKKFMVCMANIGDVQITESIK